MATVVVILSGVAPRSSSASLAWVITASVVSGWISETAPTNVVLPTPKPPATTIFVEMGARPRSVCQSCRPSCWSKPAKSTEHPFEQCAVRAAWPVPGTVHADPPLVCQVADENSDNSERHPQQRGDLGHRPHPAAQFDDRPELGHDPLGPVPRGEGQLLRGAVDRRHERLDEQHMPELGPATGQCVRAHPRGPAVCSARGRHHQRALSKAWRSSPRRAGVSTWPARLTNIAMWYATTLVSLSAAACTPSSEPSLMDMTKSMPSSMATVVCRTRPPSISLAAPTVSEASPETTAARSIRASLGCGGAWAGITGGGVAASARGSAGGAPASGWDTSWAAGGASCWASGCEVSRSRP